ncbi:2-octaprenylphenol hydroxylase [Caldanaerobius fijiensis DSM 17918]|uniref:2-octaprenylphenol hydroxylase n=1 Tax=Caldanaerobius fijiensis DSM 17918 TaxID=1121256 RepID=A0A1M4TYT7_9THEO|nr:AarF/UbiB family protein [Caldanaerobius fijiensis]SHE49516.1 2-octaprenylphenol hydroxylase [Caldanaerobius fijiensis DSM 17918]
MNRKNIKRYKKIIEVLAKNGLYILLNNLGIKTRVRKLVIDDIPLPVRIRHALEELGPTFVKLGQMISLRTDLIPQDIASELAKLQDKVKPFDFIDAKRIFESELGYRIEDVFDYFSETPIASASIGQVYVASLKSTGEKVVVKIQRPGIDDMISSDINVLAEIAQFLDEHVKNRPVSFVQVTTEMCNALKRELDYTLEARNAEKFKNLYKNSLNRNHVVIPKVYWDYTTRKVLTLEYIDGIGVKNIERIKRSHWDVKNIARIGAISFLEQVMDFGFFHGDPHPGNIMVLGDDKIAYIDFGTVGKLDRIQRRFLYNLFEAFINDDVDSMVEDFEEMGCITSSTDIISFKRDLKDIIDVYYNASIKDINMKDLISQITNIVYKHSIVLPADFTLLFKALITIEGVGKILDPDFNLSTLIKDYSIHKFKKKLDPLTYIDETIPEIKKLLRLSFKMPYLIYEILKKTEKGDMAIEIKYNDIDEIKDALREITNKLSLSIIVSALIVGSSLALQINTGPKVLDMPLFGILGYLIACVIGLWLIGTMIISSWFTKKK